MSEPKTDDTKIDTSSNVDAGTSEAVQGDKTGSPPDNAAPNASDSKTMEETLKERYEELQGDKDSQPKKDAEGKSDSKIESDKEKEKVDGDKEPTDDKKDDNLEEDEPKGPVPLERFQEVTRENRELKQTTEQMKPLVEAHNTVVDYCRKNGLNNEDFAAALELAALLKSDPVKFKERITPILEGAGVLAGDKIPSDLAKEVEEGTLAVERAKEIAQLRAQREFGTQRQKVTAEQQQAQKQQQFVQDIQTSWANWDASKRKLTPDFKPKSDPSKPDGLWEMVNDKMTAMGQAVDGQGRTRFPINSPQDAVNLAEAAYKAVLESVKVFNPRKPTTKRLSSNGSTTSSSNTDPLKAKTMEEAIRLKAGQLGVVE
jgi:hypothetical protein